MGLFIVSVTSLSTDTQTIMSFINKVSNAITVSVILNKSKREGKGQMLAFCHNGVVKQRFDASSQWLEFRLVSTDKEGNKSLVPLFLSKGKQTVEFDAEEIQTKLYSGNPMDTKFTVQLSEDELESFLDLGKAIKITFPIDGVRGGDVTEYQGNATVNFSLENVTVEILEQYHGIGKKLDPEFLLSCFAESETKASSNVITAEELVNKSARYSKNARKKDRKRAELANKAVSAPIVEEQIQEEEEVIDELIPEGESKEITLSNDDLLSLLG